MPRFASFVKDVTLKRRVLASKITSPSTASATTGIPFTYQITATGNPTQYYESGLPQQLTLNTATGLISGTPTTAEVRPVLIQVYYGVGSSLYVGAASTVIQLTVTLGLPVITSALSRTATAGSAFSYTITATNSPTSYSASDLPAGLSINTSTGAISGTPTSAGSTSITINATNATGTGTATLALTVNNMPAPVINSALSVTAVRGSAFSYTITATNSPTSYSVSDLPAGLSINTSTGVINGTPTSAGSTAITINATNLGGVGTATLTITVVTVPVITSSTNPVTMRVGNTFSYTITASDSPTSYSADNLPSGLSINSSTGLISGTPSNAAQGGDRTIVIKATNIAGTGSANISATIEAVPVVTSSTPWYNTANTSTSTPGYSDYNFAFINNPTSFSTSTLPEGVSLNLGMIPYSTYPPYLYGTPSFPGTYSITLYATNSIGTGSYNLTLIVAPNENVAPPIFVNNILSIGIGAVSFNLKDHLNLTGGEASKYKYNTINLPVGLSLDVNTGQITGSVSSQEQRTVLVYVTNPGGTGYGNLLLVIQNINNSVNSPVINSGIGVPAIVGASFNYQITATNNPTSYSALNLPNGLTINTTTGLISGIYNGAVGDTSLKISANNAGGIGVSTIIINWQVIAPEITSTLYVEHVRAYTNPYEDNPENYSYQITASNGPTSYNATARGTGQSGLTINTTTGLISGTRNTSSRLTLYITASNSAGTSTKDLIIKTKYYFNSPVVQIAGSRDQLAILRADGTVEERVYALGSYRSTSKGRQIYSNYTITQISVGFNLVFGLTSEGRVVGWSLYEVGDGYGNPIVTSVGGYVTIPTAAQSGVVKIATGQGFCLALKTDGTLVGWSPLGWNLDPGLLNFPSGTFKSIAVGPLNNIIAVRTNGTVAVWGPQEEWRVYANSPIVGARDKMLNVPASALSDVDKVYAGDYAYAVVKNNGSIVVWSRFNTNNSPPSSLQSGVVEVSMNGHSIARKNDGTLVVWPFYNDDGYPLGPATTVPSFVENPTSIFAGNFFYAAVHHSGELSVWGTNDVDNY